MGTAASTAPVKHVVGIVKMRSTALSKSRNLRQILRKIDTVILRSLVNSEKFSPVKVKHAPTTCVVSFLITQAPAINVTICITTPDGVTVTKLNVRPTVDTVHKVSKRISKATKISVSRQQLLFQGERLHHDGRTLAEHGVMAGSKLHLVKWEMVAGHADPKP